MDVEVQRAGMIRTLRNHFFGERDNFGRAIIGRSVFCPVTPRAQVHHRFNVKHRDVIVVGELEVHVAHGVGIGNVVRSALFSFSRVAKLQSIDEGLLARRRFRFQCDCFSDRFKRFRFSGRIHRRIDVRAECQRFSPKRNSQTWVETLCFAICSASFRMIKSVRKVQALIHEKLRLRILRRHGKLVIAQLLQARRDRSRGRDALLRRFFVVNVIRRFLVLRLRDARQTD